MPSWVRVEDKPPVESHNVELFRVGDLYHVIGFRIADDYFLEEGDVEDSISHQYPALTWQPTHWRELDPRLYPGEEQPPADPWTRVEDGLPEPGVPVLAFVVLEGGKTRRLRAQYSDGKSLEAFDENGWAAVYDEETDTYFCPDGWYEANEYEETHWHIEDNVTHWRPLPAGPAEPRVDAESGEEQEVCEWRRYVSVGVIDTEMRWKPSCRPNTSTPSQPFEWWRHCPGCGKPIKETNT